MNGEGYLYTSVSAPSNNTYIIFSSLWTWHNRHTDPKPHPSSYHLPNICHLQQRWYRWDSFGLKKKKKHFYDFWPSSLRTFWALNLHYRWRNHLSLLRSQVLILSCCHYCFYCCEITVLCWSCRWNMLGCTYLRNLWIVDAVLLKFRSNSGFGPECFEGGQEELKLKNNPVQYSST